VRRALHVVLQAAGETSSESVLWRVLDARLWVAGERPCWYYAGRRAVRQARGRAAPDACAIGRPR